MDDLNTGSLHLMYENSMHISDLLTILKNKSINLESEIWRNALQFSNCRGNLPIKFFNYKSMKNFFPLLRDDLIVFTRENPSFFIIPVSILSGEVIGYVYRTAVTSSRRFLNIYLNIDSEVPMMYGWSNFKSFKHGDVVIVCEGVKDALFLQGIYPNTVAILTSRINEHTVKIISSITKRAILAFDNDNNNSGKIAAEKYTSLLSKEGVSCKTIVPVAKDFGNYLITNKYTKPLIDSEIKKVTDLILTMER